MDRQAEQAPSGLALISSQNPWYPKILVISVQMMGVGFSMGIKILWWLCPGKHTSPFATNGVLCATSIAGDGRYSSGGSPPE
jgi:hypothetical protein